MTDKWIQVWSIGGMTEERWKPNCTKEKPVTVQVYFPHLLAVTVWNTYNPFLRADMFLNASLCYAVALHSGKYSDKPWRLQYFQRSLYISELVNRHYITHTHTHTHTLTNQGLSRPDFTKMRSKLCSDNHEIIPGISNMWSGLCATRPSSSCYTVLTMTLLQSQNVACHSNTVPLLKTKILFFFWSQAMKAQRHVLPVDGNMQHTSAKRQPMKTSSEFSNDNVSV